MKLKRLAINRLRGISQPFEIEAAGAGFHVVFGPNGIGKSSICRAVEGLYWEDRHPSPLTSVTGEFEWDGESWWGHRDGTRVTWQRNGTGSVSPSLPSSHHERCFFLRLRDLIEPSRDGAADIALEIRRQMSGGFDLDEISSDLFPAANRGRRQRDSFNRASEEVEKALVRQAGLQRRADQLGRLKSLLAESEAAARRRAFVERAVGLTRRRKELARVMEQIAALPAPLARLTGKEADEVRRYQDQADTFTERVRSLEQGLHRARETRRETALDGPIERAELAMWRRKAEELRRVEQDLDAARGERGATRRELVSTLSAIGGADVDKASFTLSEHRELFDFLRSSQAHGTRAGAIRERLRLIERIDVPEGAEQRLATYREAMEALHSWLRVPEPDGLVRRVRNRWPWFLLALTLVLAGVGLAALADPGADFTGSVVGDFARRLPSGSVSLPALLLGLGGGVAVSVLLMGDQPRSKAARKAAREAFERSTVDGPDKWELSSVAALARQLERQTAAAESWLQRARDRDVERQALETELEGLSGQEAALAARREELQVGLGMDALPHDAELVDFARALDQLRQARARDEAAAGKVGGLEQQHAGLLAELAAVLEQHGEPAPGDAAMAGARIHDLADRNTRLENAISEERNVAVQLDENAANLEAAVAVIRRIYSEASLNEGDFDGLLTLLGSLQRYHDLVGERTRLEGQIGLDRAELDKAGESALAECDEPTLDEIKEELSDQESGASELRTEIAEITAEMNAARRGNGMRELLAAREAARAGLRDLRDRALYAKAGRFFIHAVEVEYEHNRLPRVFERARNHFSEFTHYNFQLELDKGGETPRLFARESRSGEVRELDELSDGTRAQLLLAARIAYAEEVEQGKVLPLFLDEALDQSDPQRFEAIVRGLGRVAREQDRQIFYLTSDPLDVDRIRDALGKEDCCIASAIDLGRIRTKTASVSGADALRVDPGPAVPAPDQLSLEEYGAALAVPEFRPERGCTGQHFYYVLWDDLNLLHDFLSNGIERAGQWQTVHGTPLAESLGSRSITPAEITSRLELLEVFCELWTQGRNRPVDRDALEESGVLTDRYLEDVVDIARELDGDPVRLLAALDETRDPRLRGFRQTSVERLRRYLADTGYLDERPVLTGSELVLRARTTPVAARLPDRVANDCLKRWWGWARNSSEPGSR